MPARLPLTIAYHRLTWPRLSATNLIYSSLSHDSSLCILIIYAVQLERDWVWNQWQLWQLLGMGALPALNPLVGPLCFTRAIAFAMELAFPTLEHWVDRWAAQFPLMLVLLSAICCLLHLRRFFFHNWATPIQWRVSTTLHGLCRTAFTTAPQPINAEFNDQQSTTEFNNL